MPLATPNATPRYTPPDSGNADALSGFQSLPSQQLVNPAQSSFTGSVGGVSGANRAAALPPQQTPQAPQTFPALPANQLFSNVSVAPPPFLSGYSLSPPATTTPATSTSSTPTSSTPATTTAATTTPATTAPPASGWQPYQYGTSSSDGSQQYNPSSNSFLVSNPTATTSTAIGPITNSQTPNMYATSAAAQQFARGLGGSVVAESTPWGTSVPMYDIKLPNGTSINAGALASILGNDALYPALTLKDGAIAQLLGIPYQPGLAASLLGQGGPSAITSTPLGSTGTGETFNPGTYGSIPTSMGSQLGALSGLLPSASSAASNVPWSPAAQYGGFQQQGLPQQTAGGGGMGTDMNSLAALMQLLMMLQGGGSGPGGLYSRSQYPQFP